MALTASKKATSVKTCMNGKKTHHKQWNPKKVVDSNWRACVCAESVRADWVACVRILMRESERICWCANQSVRPIENNGVQYFPSVPLLLSSFFFSVFFSRVLLLCCSFSVLLFRSFSFVFFCCCCCSVFSMWLVSIFFSSSNTAVAVVYFVHSFPSTKHD